LTIVAYGVWQPIFRGKTYKMHAYEIFEKTFDSNWKGVIWRN